LLNRVYWEEDGTIYEKSGRMHLELFDFDKWILSFVLNPVIIYLFVLSL
jgi:hypothetical protein